MMEEVHLIAAGHDGRREAVVLEVEDSGTPDVKLVRTDGTTTVHPDVDLFECLKAVRRTLEEEGLLLCCQGARPMVFPSGMGRQMSNGRLAYTLRRDPPLTNADLVDIFASAQFSEVGTVEDQRRAVMRFFGFSNK
ncbi:hypothetical protein [Streptomyces morookaense]|uniref:Uncharacterized protein n=1 Tax=Streptomyces morookaense TaxID=1970 RepID=A0A7Y7B4N6_STRMO|nr:hypothetical protein [Streptomyces morookaense]NVK78912.1 hypothetical protein [Streptomyces morookaense]